MKTTDGRRTCRAGGHYACGQGGAVAAVVTYGTRPGADGEAKATATTTTTMKPVDREPIVIRSLSAVCRMLVMGKSDNAVFGSIRLMYSSLSSGDLSIRRSRLMLRPMSHLRFCRATFSRDKIASVTWRVAHCNFIAWTRIDQSAFTAFSRQSCTE